MASIGSQKRLKPGGDFWGKAETVVVSVKW